MALTNAIIYRSVAWELERFPAAIVREIVAFYVLAREIPRLAEHSGSAIDAYSSVRKLMPRVRMCGTLLIHILDKFERNDFSAAAEVRPTQEEVVALAEATGYPLGDIMRERGLAM